MSDNLDTSVAQTLLDHRSLRIVFFGKMPLSYVGGAEISTRLLVEALTQRGHHVSIISSVRRRSRTGLVDLAIRRTTGRLREHRALDAQSLRVMSLDPISSFSRMVRELSPDCVVVTGTAPSFAERALAEASSWPTILYVRVDAALDALPAHHLDLAVANSEFMAGLARRRGQETVFIPSAFPRDTYTVTTTREKVLFVNPVPKKGLKIALFLAAQRPDIPFVFSLSWRMEPAALRQLRREARRLGNVEIRKATADPSRLYGDARLVLVPSQWLESWGRIVSEAHLVGLPAVASRVGGLPQSVGPGGVLVHPRDSLSEWLRALSYVWDDNDVYEELSRAAQEFGRRDEISIESVVDRFEHALSSAIARHASCGGRVSVPLTEATPSTEVRS